MDDPLISGCLRQTKEPGRRGAIREGYKLALLSLNRIAWLYTSDDTQDYRVAAQKALTDQAKQGGAAYSGTGGPLPNDVLRMRRVTVRNAAQGVSRVVILYDTSAPLAVKDETINLNHLSDSYSFISDGNPLGELRARHSVTRQTT